MADEPKKIRSLREMLPEPGPIDGPIRSLPNPNVVPDLLGYNDYFNPDKYEENNPYPLGSPQAAEWLAGYNRAATECAKPQADEDENEDDEEDEEENED